MVEPPRLPRKRPRRDPLKLEITSNLVSRGPVQPWELEALAPILREFLFEVIAEHETAKNRTSGENIDRAACPPALGRSTAPSMQDTEVRPPSRATPTEFEGAWRITEMEVWDKDFIDMVVPGHITFNDESMGTFQFGAVKGWLDCRWVERGGKRGVEFSWEGEDDRDSKCGRGWAALEADGSLRGRFFIHRGDDSEFTATKSGKESGKRPPPRKRRRS